MTAPAPLAVSAVLAVHNEERFVRQCLTSLSAVADEILVAHDGPCADRSVDIAREFTPHVWTHEPRGAPETHLIRLLRGATHDWIVRLDCDETFSPGLLAELQAVKARGADPDVTHYQAIWRAVYAARDEAPARPHEVANRTVLFRRSCARWIGIPHALPEISGSSRSIRECVYHYAPHQHYRLRDLLAKKMQPFAKVDAAIRVKYPIDVFGYDGRPLEDVLRPLDRWRAERPLLAAVPLALRAGLGALGRVGAAGSITELVRNLRWPVAHGAYQLMLAWELHRLRGEGFAPRLASEAT